MLLYQKAPQTIRYYRNKLQVYLLLLQASSIFVYMFLYQKAPQTIVL